MAERSGSTRLQTEVNLEGGAIDEGARRLNPILERITARARAAADEPGEVASELMFSRLQFSKSFSQIAEA